MIQKKFLREKHECFQVNEKLVRIKEDEKVSL